MRKIPKIRHVIVTFALIFAACNTFGAPLPDDIVGKWQVKEVHLNTESGRTTEYTWNDSRLNGRIFDFTHDDVLDDVYEFADHCANPVAQDINASLRDLMLRSLGGYEYPASGDVDPVRDYKLDSAKGRHIRSFNLICAKGLWQGDLGRSGGATGNMNIAGAWIALADDQKMYMRWRDETILVLTKIPLNAPIKASFPCGKASTATEHAICSSYQLSAFDQSIAESFTRTMAQARASGSQTAPLAQSQRRWLKDRNACGANAQCILKTMRRRLDALATAGSSGD
ncbi:lysozyme inhibitor LprI family protein [Burkholderia sp. MSMB1835]|uniref:lysozyme inhibitor LprI family protein n=1 Tax=Burkholderia sp. MSMB1835 TaxID=1637876 RepID=UPI000AF138E4|nr:lysozyme inhibitor LprI family protein [Burkholderia sp. MSMB1835]